MLHSALAEAVVQVIELVDISFNIYHCKTPVASSTIGKHVRHVIDHFHAYQRGIESGCIDYNVRSRCADLEAQPLLATAQLEQFNLWLSGSPRDSFELSLVTEVSTLDRLSVNLQSNSHRELVYLLNHTYHHIALATTLARTLDVSPPERLGVAPATASYLRDCSVLCAP